MKVWLHLFIPERMTTLSIADVRATARGLIGGPHRFWPLRYETPPEAISRTRALIAVAAQRRHTQATLCLRDETLVVVRDAIARGLLAPDEVARWRLSAFGGEPRRASFDARGRDVEEVEVADGAWGPAILAVQVEYIYAATALRG